MHAFGRGVHFIWGSVIIGGMGHFLGGNLLLAYGVWCSTSYAPTWRIKVTISCRYIQGQRSVILCFNWKTLSMVVKVSKLWITGKYSHFGSWKI